MTRYWTKVAIVVMQIAVIGPLVVPAVSGAQTLAGTITGSGSTWADMALYEAGGKLFVDDVTNARVLVYNARSLAYITEISFSAYLPRYPMMLAMHQGTGTLYVALGTGSATNDTIIVPVNASTYATGPNLTNNGWDLFMVIDEARARLYLVGSKGLGDVLTAVNINTNTVAGTLNLYTLMGDGLMSFGREALNQATGELVFANLQYDKFLIVNGPALTGQLITATSSRGRAPAWNPAEHKLYITTVAWNGYFIYDADTASSSVTPCVNDGTKTFYSQATNRMYTSAELTGWPLGTTTVINGATDACQNHTLPLGGLTSVGFVNSRRHAYFAGTLLTIVLDEDTLTPVAAFPGSAGYGAVDNGVLVDQAHGRVFVRNTWSQPSQDSSIVAIDDGGGTTQDFDGDGKSDVLWHHATQGEVWLWPMDGATRAAETYVRTVADTNWEIRGIGDFDGDGRADILWRNKTTGMIYFWPMDGSTPLSETYVGTVDPAYDIVGTGDYNGDGRADILWRHLTNGEVWIWLMDGATPLEQQYVATVEPAYAVVGSGDLNGDGASDIVWRHSTNGEVWVWISNGTPAPDRAFVGVVPDLGYSVAGVADLDGDGKADILWHHATTGEVWLWPMDGATRLAETWVGTVPDTGYTIAGTGDYNGDGKADILWHHATVGEVWVWLMDGTTPLSQTFVATVPDLGYQIVKVK
jgi:hypothetical protein